MSERISIKEVEYLQKRYKLDECEIVEKVGVFFYHKGALIFPILGEVEERIETDGKLILMFKGKVNWPRESVQLFFEETSILLGVGEQVLLNKSSFLFNSLYYLTQMDLTIDARTFFKENSYTITKIINPLCLEIRKNQLTETVLVENLVTESDFITYINEQRKKTMPN